MIFRKIRDMLKERVLFYLELIECDRKAGTVANAFQHKKAVEILNNVIDMVDQVEAEYNNGWISVDDRLPRQNEEVIASLLVDDKPLVVGITYNHTWLDDGLSKMIAWQPLPQPYKQH